MCQSRPARARRGTFSSADPFAARAAFCRRSQSCHSLFATFSLTTAFLLVREKQALAPSFLAPQNFQDGAFKRSAAPI